MKKINTAMALRWLIFLPFILIICIILGVVQGTFFMLKKITSRIWKDLEIDA